MNYSALIQNRKSVRSFTDKKVPLYTMAELRSYFQSGVKRLIPGIKTELRIFGDDAKQALEGAAGYNQFLVGAPQYLVLLTEKHPQAHLNAGFIMQDLVLKLTDMEYDSCWVTFTDSQLVKQALEIVSDLDVAAIVAYGIGVKATKRLRINIRSMSNIDISAKRHYFEPKKSISDLVFLEKWGNREGVNQHIGFFDDILWEALYAVSHSPSYLNRQAYAFVLKKDGHVILVRRPDAYNTELDSQLSLGIALLHFTAVAEEKTAGVNWSFGPEAAQLDLPEGCEVVASCVV